ncbi:MAG: hypothetical protein ACLT0Y_01845 [Christensenellales bacterium]
MASPQNTAQLYRQTLPCALVRALPEEEGGYGPAEKIEAHWQGPRRWP